MLLVDLSQYIKVSFEPSFNFLCFNPVLDHNKCLSSGPLSWCICSLSLSNALGKSKASILDKKNLWDIAFVGYVFNFRGKLEYII